MPKYVSKETLVICISCSVRFTMDSRDLITIQIARIVVKGLS